MSEQGLGEGPLEDVSEVTGGTQNIMLRFTRSGRDLRAAPRTAASAPAQQQRDPAGDQGAGGAGRHRRAAPAPDRQLRRHQRARRRGLLSDGAGRRLQRRRGAAAAACGRPGGAVRDGTVDGRRAGQAGGGRPCRRRPQPISASRTASWNAKCRAGFRSWSPIGSSKTTRAQNPRGRATSPPGCEQGRPSAWTPGIMHGDYHAANVMFSRTGPEVVAIVDWEMCTIGDPLLDLGWLLATWRQSDGFGVFATLSASQGGLASTDDLVERYAAQHHPRPVAHHLVHRAGLLQARHRASRARWPGPAPARPRRKSATNSTRPPCTCSSGRWDSSKRGPNRNGFGRSAARAGVTPLASLM